MTERQFARMVNEFCDDLGSRAEAYDVAFGSDNPLSRVLRDVVGIAYRNLQEPLEHIADDAEEKQR